MPALSWQERVKEQGALVEAWLEGGVGLSSPSVQGFIHPGGAVEVLSTHEQILGGPSGQTYLGCRFPADGAYRKVLMEHGLRVGQALAAEGALERFGVDFIARRMAGQWDLQAIEVNLRQGGTTHPYMALCALTTGWLDPASGRFLTPTGEALYKYADEALAKSLEFQATVKRFDPAAAQTLSIVIQQALANYITPAALATFLRDRPDARVSIHSEPLSQTIKLMREDRVDAAIAMASPEKNEFEGVIIGATPLLIVASPRHPLAKSKRIAVSDLEHFDLVAGMQGSVGWGMLDSILKESGLRKPRIVLRMQSVVSVINAVIHDIGLACAHACAARQEIADGKLVVIETDPPLPPVPIKLMIHQKTMCRELIEALMSTLIVGEDQLNLPGFCSPHLPAPKQSAKQTA
jgi:DNA-binding transcriptional LysR family regulator